MKNIVEFLSVVLVLIAAQAFAGNGDLTVDGKLSVGATQQHGTVNVGGGEALYLVDSASTINYPSVPQSGTGISIVGPTSIERLVVQDGNGRFNQYWNAYGDNTVSPSFSRYIVSNEPANRFQSSVNLESNGGFFSFYGAPAGVAGDAISWTQTGYISSNELVWFSPRGTSSDFSVSNDGRVGIGTTTPSFALEVIGQVASNGVALTSDAKYKKNLKPIDTPLEKVMQLKGVSYIWKSAEYKNKNFPEGRHYGVIAQEVEKVLPEVVNTAKDGTKSVAYTEIIPVLIEAVKEQQKLIERQMAELKEIREQLRGK